MSDESQQKSVYKDPSTQGMLNTPLSNQNGLSTEEAVFLDFILALIDKGKIDVHKPSSLINNDVYVQLEQSNKAHVELESVNLINSVREIRDLNDNGFRETFQMKNLVSTVFHIKSRIEVEQGDVFII